MELLARQGEVHVTGSHALRLMTSRDLDIHLLREDASIDACFALGRDLATLLEPHRMHYRDETTVATPGLPRGRYWGIYLEDERASLWKIDIWMTDRATWAPTRAFVA